MPLSAELAETKSAVIKMYDSALAETRFATQEDWDKLYSYAVKTRDELKALREEIKSVSLHLGYLVEKNNDAPR